MSITKLNNLSISAVTALPSGVGGKVLQVITATDSTVRNTSSTSFVTASNTLSVSITPSSASNKIYISISGNIYNSAGNEYSVLTIFRGATDLGAASNKGLANLYTGSEDQGTPFCITILDSPSTTSAITYQLYFRKSAGIGNAYLNEDSCKGSITAFEIAG